MTRSPRRATTFRRPLARSSLSKNSRRHGDGNEATSRRWMASMSRFLAVVIRISSIPLLLKLNLGLGETNVDRRDVGVAIELAVARDLDRAARAADGDVSRVEKVRDVDHDLRRLLQLLELRRGREPWRHDRLAALEVRHVVLAASGIVDDEKRRGAGNDRLVRRHRHERLAEGEGESLPRREADAHAGERSRSARHGEELNRLAIDVRLGENEVDRRKELLVARVFALQRDG